MSNRLFSYPQIVGISIFLLIILIISFTGVPTLSMPELPTLIGTPLPPEAFHNKCDDVPKIKRSYCDNAKSLDDYKSELTSDQFAQVQKQKTKIKNAGCSELFTMYEKNTKWTLRGFVAWRLVYDC